MERMTYKEIVDAVQGKIILKGENFEFNAVSTDTRKIEKGNIFFALKGENFNGNNYIKEASEKGAVICIVDEIKYKEEDINKNTTVIKVEDTRKALLDLAEFYRSKLDVKVIGITGSTGKTSTKDLVAAVLSSKYKVFKTEGNFNNQIGLPLMIFKLDNSYDIAVLEMGMNNLNEIHTMAKAARPDIALITNVGTAHIGNLGNRENILKAKLEITDYFSKNNTLIVNSDNDLLSNIKEHNFRLIKTAIDNEGNFKAENIYLGEEYVEFSINESSNILDEKYHIDVPGKHTISNGLLAIVCGKILGLNYAEITDGLKKLQTTAMRLDIIKGEKFTIINDCYNANPDSMKAAIDVLKNLKAKRKIAVLGTMGELGHKSFNAHTDIGRYAFENGVDVLITIGEFSKAYEEGYNCLHKFKAFGDIDSASKYLLEQCLQYGDAILIKASRAMKLEIIVDILKKNNC
ncbi:UDP-N-acetylmuramoyl-tripeptide--D-alanyl-D-alanine ligase [Clostridium sp. DJ247]|uniref:UDP-N-acetylmuramoyl-tripeptide--D-alanyl-D- alanine ligase n=1 Tax=Clostridium sp. DJ247 TaxID=2726188 RepID=UPI001628DDE2|nr:UDP-N-acetylmuramoyl-tripeptide--D-alanyl-D-alanine ligase [Clostridium sp. DJ247]MBC2580654.1 UDP-N-acetylmuramoyl-tripeptide--D-alanyl-D-alanine ligase [Clostridium sp. DJ247]MBC2580695.1 UDP-N-acetylmuramoyl-tripeptide--D-alanyl-D-alanine ligase [Clostridium sp. DJ247]